MPVGPTASAIGTVESPVCAPMSMATSPSRRNAAQRVDAAWVTVFGVFARVQPSREPHLAVVGNGNVTISIGYSRGADPNPSARGRSLSFTA